MTDDAAVAVWTVLLDDMDRELAFVADRLAATGNVVATPAFAPPNDLPPLPASLRNRVQLLLERTRRAEEEVAARSHAVQSQLHAVDRRQREAQPMRPAFFDRAF